MSKQQNALRQLAIFTLEKVSQCSAQQQMEIFEFLAVCLPDRNSRECAERIAINLREACALQQKLSDQIKTPTTKP